MLDSQLDIAKKHGTDFSQNYLKYPISNMTFIQGYLEDLSMIKNETVDILISNCVICLCPQKIWF